MLLARPSLYPETMSRRSGRDPNASSFNLFTGEEVPGGLAPVSRPTQHPFNRGSSLRLGDPDAPDDRFSHVKGSFSSNPSSARFQPEHPALSFQSLGPMPTEFGYEYDDYPPEELRTEDPWTGQAPSVRLHGHGGDSERPSVQVSIAVGRKSTFTVGDPDMVDDRFAHHTHRSNMGSSRANRELAAPIGSENRRRLVRSGNPAPAADAHQFFGSSPASHRRESSDSFARNDNQNSGNFITDRPTTRVIAPPGGRNSMGTSFGWQ